MDDVMICLDARFPKNSREVLQKRGFKLDGIKFVSTMDLMGNIGNDVMICATYSGAMREFMKKYDELHPFEE